MNTYKIITTSTCMTEYEVKANSSEDAEKNYLNSNWTLEDITDYQDETITEIKAL